MDLFGFDVSNVVVVEKLGVFAEAFGAAQDGVVADTTQASGGANANAFDKKFDDLDNLFMFRPQAVQRLRFGKGFVASDAAVTLDDAIFIVK